MGLVDVFRVVDKSDNGQLSRKKPSMVVIWIIIIAVIFLAVGSFPREEKGTSQTEEIAKSDALDFVKTQKEGLEKILKKINGAGDVSVFISIDGGGEKILARDNRSKYSKESADGTDVTTDEESESNVVISGKSSSGEPYIVEEKAPEVTGILVVAEGAADEKVRIEIYEAVKALYGVSPHRIRVTY